MKKIIILSIITLSFASCADSLMDREPISVITEDKVWSDASLTNAYLTEAYTQTSVFTNDVEYQDRNMGSDNGQMHFAQFMTNSVSDESKFNRTRQAMPMLLK